MANIWSGTEFARLEVPIEISQDNLAIKYNPENIMTLEKDGCEEPVIISQSMPAMRSGFQLGPLPEKHMRDYNLYKPSRGIMVHCLRAAYPWWKATYEEGGAPGIIWADYLCDGFATETQKRELKLLTEHFKSMKRN